MRLRKEMCLFAVVVFGFAACDGEEDSSTSINEAQKFASGEDAAADGAYDGGDVSDAGIDRRENSNRESAVDLQMLARGIEERVKMLDLREREIVHREQLLDRLENAAIGKTEELLRLKDEVAAMLAEIRESYQVKRKERLDELASASGELSEERDVRVSHLVETIKGMRSSAGAGLLTSMDERDAVTVLRKLGARQAAALLGEMPPRKAAALAREMLGPKSPGPDLLGDMGDAKKDEGADR